MARRDARRWRSFVFVLIPASLASLMLAELLFRSFRPQILHWNSAAVWEPVEGLGWQHRANLDVVVNTGNGRVRVLTDALGHRIGNQPVSDARLSILAIGDSFVEALQVEHEATMTALLGRSLSNHLGMTVDVVNAGLGGRNPNHYLLAAQRELDLRDYDLVLVFLFVQNDRVVGLEDHFPARRGLGPMASAVDSSTPAPLTLQEKAHQFLSSHSHLWVFATNIRILLDLNPEDSFLEHFLVEQDRFDAWNATGEALSTLAELSGRQRAETLFVLLPPYWFFDDTLLDQTLWAFGLTRDDIDTKLAGLRLLEELSSRGLDAIDVTPRLKSASEAGIDDLYGTVDKHFAAGGHRVMADFLFNEVLARLPAKTGPVGDRE